MRSNRREEIINNILKKKTRETQYQQKFPGMLWLTDPEILRREPCEPHVRCSRFPQHLRHVVKVVDVRDGVVQRRHDQRGMMLQRLVGPQLVVAVQVFEAVEHRLQAGVGLEESANKTNDRLESYQRRQRTLCKTQTADRLCHYFYKQTQ